MICCSKGIENGTLLTPYEILIEELPGKFHPYLCALSGPSFAKEVAQGLPTSVTIASANEALARELPASAGFGRVAVAVLPSRALRACKLSDYPVLVY